MSLTVFQAGFPNLWMQDSVATLILFAVAIAWLRLVNFFAAQGWIASTLSRKIIHTGTGPIFVIGWILFSDAWSARYFAALIPLAITLQFVAVGTGLIKDPAAIEAMTRTGDRTELLRGPLYYGLIFVICTLVFWRTSPVGVLALMVMCGGDGLADIVGRRLGHRKLPFSTDKSWMGSGAMWLGSFGFGWGFLALLNGFHYWQPALNLGETLGTVALIALAATLVEALPFPDVDNLTLTLTTVGLGLWLF